MARSVTNLILTIGLATAGTLAHSSGFELDERQPIQLDARSSDFDYGSSSLKFHQVRIAQGRLWVEADEATANGLDFKASVWHFSGHVRIGMPDSTLQSDTAIITFTNNQVAVADIVGSPASFEQKRGAGVARGHANHIEYRPADARIRLDGSAWLSDGSSEINGTTLVYDLSGQRVLANPADQANDRVHLTIQPHLLEHGKPTAPAAPVKP